MTIRPSLRFLLPAIAITILAGGALAQQKPAAAPAKGADLPTISAPPIRPVFSPAHLAAARQVIIATGISRSFQPVIPALMGQIDATITRTRPELAKDLNEVLTNLRPEFAKHEGEMLDNAAQVFAASIDKADLLKIAAFFKSPVGKSYVAAEPLMLQRLELVEHQWTEHMSEHMMTRVREEMQKRGKQL